MRKTIFVIEDEEKLRKTIVDYLKMNDYEIIQAEDGKQALDLYYENNTRIDLILLDVMLPYYNGFEVLEEIRTISDTPVIFLTAKDGENDQLRGFNQGADDYITKPFLLSVLKARIEVIFKRLMKNELWREKGNLRIEEESRKVFLDKQEVSLTPKEYDLLYYFIENENIVLTRSQILDAVWGLDYDGGERTVDTVIKQLRIKLGKENPYIQSIYGVGYRFEV
ncbi:response regulator transcription factor [Velocimicrobium porci]|uniref:Stage 0 sporulation protein A homolog n=1 Tax=Velocimicrobium porci TaxID=2606634 RepID=A0A6L5XYX1_9FIRM|nr:response regulator transcription factor [Velocimicrobium porci]MSS63962.1 response regulator transcription factor [Velocimicrobium porci]